MNEVAGTEPATPSQSTPARHALVVEDSEEWNSIIGAALRDAGLHVTSVQTAAEAIQHAQASNYDIALIDYVLGDSTDNGIDVAQAIRRANPNAVIIILTGWPDLHLPETERDVKIDDLMVKGQLSAQILRDRVAMALSRQQFNADALNVAYLDTVVNDSLSAIAHELRTPMVTIQLQAEALFSGALGTLSAAELDAVRVILSQARRGLNLVTGHLEINRIANRSALPEVAGTDVVSLLREDLAAWQPIAAEKKVVLRLDAPASSCAARIDQNVLRIALNPLMENAIKFSPAGGTVRILLTAADGSVKITVSDSGPGMSSSDISDFTGMHSATCAHTSSRAQGTRLGLTIARRAAELHGGHLEISASGTGVAMTLLLKEYNGVAVD